MSVPAWITTHLDAKHVRYRVRHHPKSDDAAAAAAFEHVSACRFGKVTVVVADKKPVLLVMPAYATVDPARARFVLHARDLHVARDREIARLLPGADAGTTPPLRHWPGVEVWMDPLLQHEGPFLFQAGTHEDAIELDFKKWLEIVEPRVGVFVQPTFIGA
jgi:Ala-tRNA(Pro) deacylase